MRNLEILSLFRLRIELGQKLAVLALDFLRPSSSFSCFFQLPPDVVFGSPEVHGVRVVALLRHRLRLDVHIGHGWVPLYFFPKHFQLLVVSSLGLLIGKVLGGRMALSRLLVHLLRRMLLLRRLVSNLIGCLEELPKVIEDAQEVWIIHVSLGL